MAGGSQIAKEARNSRTSTVLLILGGASIYYSTQIQLNYDFKWWNMVIAGAGTGFLVAGLYLMYKDHKHESEYRGLERREKQADVRSKEAEIDELEEKKSEVKQDTEPPATVSKEGDSIPQTQRWT